MMSPLEYPTAWRSIHAGCCLILLSLISWALLTPDPFAVVQNGPLEIVVRLDDLILHCGVYLVFAAACTSLVVDAREAWVRTTVVGLLCLHAVGTEFLQAFVPGRTSDVFDAMANLTGIAVACFLVRRASRWLRTGTADLAIGVES
jgi:VanZ family protein